MVTSLIHNSADNTYSIYIDNRFIGMARYDKDTQKYKMVYGNGANFEDVRTYINNIHEIFNNI